MFNKSFLVLLGSLILCNYFSFVEGLQIEHLHEKVLRVGYPTLIGRARLYDHDLFRVVVSNLGSYKQAEIESALVFLTVIHDDTLGYHFDPIFPYVTDKKPVLDCKAARNKSRFVMSPSTVAFKVDFTKESMLHPPTRALAVTLYRDDVISTFNYNNTIHNYTEQLITMVPSEVNGQTLYNLDLVLFIENEGLYKFYLQTCENDMIFFEDIYLTDFLANFLNVGIIFFLFVHYIVIRMEFSTILPCHNCTKVGFIMMRMFALLSMMVTAYNCFDVREYHEMYSCSEYAIIIVLVIGALVLLDICLRSSFGTVGKIISILMLLHFVLKNLHRGGSDTTPFGDVLVYLHKTFILILMTTMLDIIVLYIGETVDPRFKEELRIWHEVKFRSNYIIPISYFVCMLCSCDLVLAILVLFEAPFGLYWVPFFVEYFLAFILWGLFIKYLVEVEKLFFGRITRILARAG